MEKQKKKTTKIDILESSKDDLKRLKIDFKLKNYPEVIDFLLNYFKGNIQGDHLLLTVRFDDPRIQVELLPILEQLTKIGGVYNLISVNKGSD